VPQQRQPAAVAVGGYIISHTYFIVVL
jgi:hypothetical protein